MMVISLKIVVAKRRNVSIDRESEICLTVAVAGGKALFCMTRLLDSLDAGGDGDVGWNGVIIFTNERIRRDSMSYCTAMGNNKF
mmetsp:Transcript_41235/g.74322  ORF Transcript_41235/g.74322 Transcript_41235/m.74322 type:complete len:84 (-) Transcript_41235:47-298(-)